MNKFHHFDPYKEDKERKRRELIEDIKLRKEQAKKMSLSERDPIRKVGGIQRSIMARAEKRGKVPVTLPKLKFLEDDEK